MRIQGLQKLTLLDYPDRTACTIFLSGCNFRCPFCHNTPLLTADAADGMAEEELLAFLKKRQGLLDGVAITGGEPLLRPDLPALLEKIKELGYAVKLDTNGAFPDRLEQIVRAGLADYVAMDVKNSPARYAQTVGAAEFDLAPIEKSVSFLLRGIVDLSFQSFFGRKDVEDISIYIIAHAKRNVYLCARRRTGSPVESFYRAEGTESNTYEMDICRFQRKKSSPDQYGQPLCRRAPN